MLLRHYCSLQEGEYTVMKIAIIVGIESFFFLISFFYMFVLSVTLLQHVNLVILWLVEKPVLLQLPEYEI